MKLHGLLVGVIGAVVGLGFLLPPAVGAAGNATTVNVTAGKPSEFGFILSTKTLPHGTVTFRLKNGGAISHDLKICASPRGAARTAARAS